VFNEVSKKSIIPFLTNYRLKNLPIPMAEKKETPANRPPANKEPIQIKF
jgi:hypothetical protein